MKGFRLRMILYPAMSVLAACAAQASDEAIVSWGPRDPAYAIPEHLRPTHAQEKQRNRDPGQLQQKVMALHNRLRSDPRFGGLILRWDPEPHAIVMFTGDAEAQLRRYTQDPHFRPQRVDLTMAQLEQMKDAFGHDLSGLGLRCFSVDGDEEHNSVTVGAPPDELQKIRIAISQGRLTAPSKLRLNEQGCAEFR